VSAPVLQVEGLQARYGARDVLHGISFTVADGGISVMLGANGAGKTTTLRALCGMVRTSGAITLSDERIDGLATEAIVRRGVGHVPEGRGTFKDLTVEENLRVGAYPRRDKSNLAADFDRVYGYFPRLRERHRQQAGTLSGGEQQMLAISRALMQRPRLLLLDEPSFGIAPIVVREIFDILRRVNASERMTMLMVEQKAELALGIAGQAFVLETGRIVVAGSAAEMRDNERVRNAYLGY
jgi:branched-chain amino acid transport system ATP-binding protein